MANILHQHSFMGGKAGGGGNDTILLVLSFDVSVRRTSNRNEQHKLKMMTYVFIGWEVTTTHEVLRKPIQK